MKRLSITAGSVTLLLALSGCSGMGSNDFSCPGYPGKPLCLSASEIYRLTDGSGPLPAAMAREESPGDQDMSPDAVLEELW
jgi:hypothetical protein